MPDRQFDFTLHTRAHRAQLTLYHPHVQVLAVTVTPPCRAVTVTLHQVTLPAVTACALDALHADILQLTTHLQGVPATLARASALLYGFLRGRVADEAQIDCWLRLACLTDQPPAWRTLATSVDALPLIGEVQQGQYALMPWHRDRRESVTRLPLVADLGQARYERLATAYWAARRVMPDERQEPSAVVREQVQQAVHALPDERPPVATSSRPHPDAFVWPDPYGRLFAPTGRYSFDAARLPTGEVFDWRLDLRRPHRLRAHAGTLWIDSGAGFRRCEDPELDLSAALTRLAQHPAMVKVGPAGAALLGALGASPVP